MDFRTFFWSGFLAGSFLLAACSAPQPTPLDWCGPKPVIEESDEWIRLAPGEWGYLKVHRWEKCIIEHGGTP